MPRRVNLDHLRSNSEELLREQAVSARTGKAYTGYNAALPAGKYLTMEEARKQGLTKNIDAYEHTVFIKKHWNEERVENGETVVVNRRLFRTYDVVNVNDLTEGGANATAAANDVE